ncbi:MAG: low molecular weight protein-tyrosine-phosphatase [Gammaproteobacteria bacterium]
MPENREKRSVLFVCMGNICRSPMAEGVFSRRLAHRASHLNIEIDSAGTHGYHAGSPPDERAQGAAARRGIDMSSLVARAVTADDFDKFDYILAMDTGNLEFLLNMAAPAQRGKIRLFFDYSAGRPGGEVPDPYYGGPAGFERVLDLIEEATEGLIDELINAANRD